MTPFDREDVYRMGVGATRRLSAVRWGVADTIVGAWVFTLPAAGAVAAVAYWLTHAGQD